MSVRINLLPHREERRKRGRQHFAVLAGLTAVLGIVIVGAGYLYISRQITTQEERNAFLKSEIGAGYRSESVVDDALDVRQWPVTASLYLTPVPAFYAGAGVGLYHTTFDYASGVPFEDETRQDFGMHGGGGFNVPISPNVGLDLNGRYVWMEDQESPMLPTSAVRIARNSRNPVSVAKPCAALLDR